MKNRMLVTVFLPAAGKTYEFWIPRELSISYTTELLSKYFASQQIVFKPDSNSVLCDRKSGRILNGNLCIDQLERMDNPVLMLI